MRNTASMSFALGLAAVFALTPGAADGAGIKADQCHALGCRVVIQGDGDETFWCCCEKKGSTSCDVISAHPGGPNPTLRPRMTRPPTGPRRSPNPNLRRTSPRRTLPVK